MKTIGILGAGQLARMMAIAGIPLGFKFRFLDPTPDSPASSLGQHIIAPFEDLSFLSHFAQGCDFLTYEFENIPGAMVQELSKTCSVFPPAQALESSQDRLIEKQFFNQQGIETAPFYPVNDLTSLKEAVALLKFPLILKTRRLGYDGKGQALVKSWDEAQTAFENLTQSTSENAIIAEGFVSFDRELSLIAVRNIEGTTLFYPLVENFHHQGILRLSLAPAGGDIIELNRQAALQVGKVLQKLNYVGVLTVEFFEKAGKLIANEMAPRVHNSGHWTIEGAETSQFENHIRAVAGLPLGDVSLRGYSAMINLIGTMPELIKVLQIPSAHFHDYNKEPRNGRKLGHITLRTDSLQLLSNKLQENLYLLPDPVALAWQNRMFR